MNIQDISQRDNDLNRFLKFAKKARLEVIEEDWDNMCGIIIANTFGGVMNDSVCLSFHDDGSFRALINTPLKNEKQLFYTALNKELMWLGFWGLLKLWWRSRKSHE